MLVINSLIPLLLAATAAAGPLFRASPLTVSLDHHKSNSKSNSIQQIQQQQQEEAQKKIIETLTAENGRFVTITYTPAKATPTTTLSVPSPQYHYSGLQSGPRETATPSVKGVLVELRDGVFATGSSSSSSSDDDSSASSDDSSDDSSSSTSSSDDSSSSDDTTASTSTSSSSSSSSDDDEDATTAANKAATTPVPDPPTNNPAVASALAQQGYSQETYYSCKTYAATSTHCGWHVPVVYVGGASGGAARMGGNGVKAGAVGAAAACGFVMNYMLG